MCGTPLPCVMSGKRCENTLSNLQFGHAVHTSVKTDEVNTTESDKCVDNSTNPCKTSEYPCNCIETEDSDEEPVYGTNDYKSQSGIIKPFHVRVPPCLISFNLRNSMYRKYLFIQEKKNVILCIFRLFKTKIWRKSL